MRLEPGKPKSGSESILPMINVVFLMLIFFMMAATLAPPDPLSVTPPVSTTEDEAGGGRALSIGPGGELAFGDLRGETAIPAAISAALEAGEGTVRLRADEAAPALRIVQVVKALSAGGATQIRLISREPSK